MKNMLIDYVSPQGDIALTTHLDKVSYNVNLIDPFKQSIAEKKNTNQTAFTLISVVGRWIVVYQANVADDKETMMYFIDFSIDMQATDLDKIFSANTFSNIKQLQIKYKAAWNEKFDTVELSFAEIYEKILKANIFYCDDDRFVLSKAKQLGALPVIETLKDGDTLKVSFVDEKLVVDEVLVINVYALIHFGETAEEKSGFGYIKLYDLLNNRDNVNDFLMMIEKLGGQFDRAFFIEKFMPAKLN